MILPINIRSSQRPPYCFTVIVLGSFPGRGGLKETKNSVSSPFTRKAQYCGGASVTER